MIQILTQRCKDAKEKQKQEQKVTAQRVMESRKQGHYLAVVFSLHLCVKICAIPYAPLRQ
jgi:hypothetical protein